MGRNAIQHAAENEQYEILEYLKNIEDMAIDMNADNVHHSSSSSASATCIAEEPLTKPHQDFMKPSYHRRQVEYDEPELKEVFSTIEMRDRLIEMECANVYGEDDEILFAEIKRVDDLGQLMFVLLY